MAAKYPLNGNLNDYVKGHVAGYQGNISFVSTPFTRGVSIPGDSSAGYFYIPEVSFKPSGFAVSLWISFYSFSGKQSIFSYLGKGNTGFILGYDSPAFIWEDVRGDFSVKVPFVISRGEYHHLIYSGKGKEAVLYIDGKVSGQDFLPQLPETGKLLIGVDQNGQAPLNAIVDEVCIFDKYLSARQADSLYRTYKFKKKKS